MYNLNQFSDNGVSWPFSINDLTGKNLEKEYFTFPKQSTVNYEKKYYLKTKSTIKIF